MSTPPTLLSGDTEGRRIAGAYMLIASGLWLMAFATATVLSATLLSAIASVPAGYFLLRGHRFGVKVSLLVLFVGLVGTAIQCPEGSRAWLVVPGLLVASMMLLCFGDAGKTRIAVGTTLFLVFVLGIAGMIAVDTAAWD